MPLNATDYRAAHGRYENQNSVGDTQETQQRILNHIAQSHPRATPNRCNPLSLFYGSLVLQHVQQVCNSPLSGPPPPRPGANPEGDIVSTAPLPPPSSATSRLSELPFSPGVMGDRAQTAKHVYPAKAIISTSWGVGLPLAEAFSIGGRGNTAKYDFDTKLLIVEGDFCKRLMLSAAKRFLAENHGFSSDQLNDLEFKWLQRAADAPITLSNDELELVFRRGKRISHKTWEKNVAHHIENNCAVETEIYNPQGASEGELLIFKAQRLENPFRMIYDNLPGYEPSSAVENTSEGTNFLVNTFTLGFKPLIGGLIANYYRKRYYDSVGDTICATRQMRLSFAQIATSLEVDGLSSSAFPSVALRKPKKLENAMPFQKQATYILQNKQNHIQSEMVLTARPQGSTAANDVMILKPRGRDKFEAISLTPDQSELKRANVVYDKQEKIWRFDEGARTHPLDIQVQEGQSFVNLYGDNYPVRVADNMQLEITVVTANGVKQYFPIYMDKLTKTWHLAILDTAPFYSPLQKNIINKLKIEVDPRFAYRAIDNLHPDYYGTGRIFEVRNLRDDIATTPPLYLAVEMADGVVPIIQQVMKNHGVKISAINTKSTKQTELPEAFPLECIDGRWRLERSTSPHISPKLAEQIMPDMIARNLKERQLSVPDQQGIKWADDKGYLKVRGRYIEVRKNRLTELGPLGGKTLTVIYKDNQFQPITSALWNSFKNKISDAWQFEGLFDKLKDLSKELLKDELTYDDIEEAIASLFTPMETDLVATSSDSLDYKRFIATTENDQYVVETTLSGQHVNVLQGVESELALSKYRRALLGGDIKQIIALQRDLDARILHPDSRTQIDTIARARLASGALLIKATLENHPSSDPHDTMLVVGHADFLQTSIFENNAFTSPDNAYKALSELFLPLSADYPTAIIIPGSIYISQVIPEDMVDNALTVKQQGQIRSIADAVNFSAIIVPVFHQGKLITIARKGEYLSYRTPATEQGSPSVTLTELDSDIPPTAMLTFANERPNPYIDASEWVGVKTGTLFAGKTLLPKEKGRAELLFCFDQEGNRVKDIDTLFSNEFMIDDNKFLIVVEDEFIQHGDTPPKVRTLAFPKNVTLNDNNRYDWIIHPAAGDELDTSLLSVGYNYLHADSFNSPHLVSEVNQRLRLGAYSEEEKVTRYEFLDE